jgi:hypothetical protein
MPPKKPWERANIDCDADSTIFVSSHPPTFVAITLRAALVAAAEAEVRTFRLTACAAALLRACLEEGKKISAVRVGSAVRHAPGSVPFCQEKMPAAGTLRAHA